MDIFGTDKHKIIHGDALKVLQTEVIDNSVDLIFADPPSNIGKSFNGHIEKWKTEEAYLDWCYKWLDLCIQKSFFIRGDQHGSSLLIPGGMLLFPQAYCCTQDHWTVQQLEPPYLHFQISKVILLFSRECTNCFPQCFPRRNARGNSQHFKLLTFIEAMSAISDG